MAGSASSQLAIPRPTQVMHDLRRDCALMLILPQALDSYEPRPAVIASPSAISIRTKPSNSEASARAIDVRGVFSSSGVAMGGLSRGRICVFVVAALFLLSIGSDSAFGQMPTSYPETCFNVSSESTPVRAGLLFASRIPGHDICSSVAQ